MNILSSVLLSVTSVICMERSTNTSPELQQFPEVSKKKADAAAAITSRLKGDPAFVLTPGDTDPSANQDDGGDPASGSSLTELERLACLVEEIDNAIAVAPLEAFVVSPLRQIIANPSFHGLDCDQASQLYNYFHLRRPDLPERARIVLASDGLVRAGDFWDPLVQDLDGSWAVGRDNTGAYVTLRNYLYPGALSFHRPESAEHGYAYFGDGRRNPDIAFML